MSAMKPKAIRYDATFEKQWDKYLKRLTAKEKEQLKDQLSIFKVMHLTNVLKLIA